MKLDPEKKEISVSGKLILDSRTDKSAEPYFYLNRNMALKTFTLNQASDYKLFTEKSDIPFMPQSVKIHLKSHENKGKIESNEIDFSYCGSLDKLPQYFANVISEDWTELGMYYPCFPYAPDIGHFTYRVEVELPPSYRLCGLGNIERDFDTKVIISNMPTNDIVICASRDVKHHDSLVGKSWLKIFHYNLEKPVLDKMTKEITTIVNCYNNWFGENNQNICIIQLKRTEGGGYARIGGIVLGGFDPQKYYLHNEANQRYFAYELGHLWLHKAKTSTWEDWLNESFAEYSALMVIRELFGNDAFEQRLEKKRMNSRESGAIFGFDRNDAKTATPLLYDKGSLLLFELEQKIGKQEFILLTKNIFENQTSTTAQLLKEIKNTLGEKVSKWFEHRLKHK